MADFPHSLSEFKQRFDDEEACAEYLAAARWPRGFVYPSCGGNRTWRLGIESSIYECAGCGRQTSVTAGTIMHQSKVPLTAWFWATYVLAAQPDGMSALQLQRELGLGSYRTAWLLCSKLRLSMVEPDRALLSGAVEIGRSEIRYRGKSGCAPGSSKTRCRITIIGAIEVKGLRLGRLRLGTLSEVSPACLSGFLAANLAPDAIAKTGTWAGCPNSLNIDCSSHLTLTADDNLHWIKRVFAELQSWILAVPHGLRCEHLQSYLDEFAFRFSRRHARDAAFRSLLGIAAAHLPVSLETLVVRDPGANSRAAGSVGPQSRNGYAT